MFLRIFFRLRAWQVHLVLILFCLLVVSSRAHGQLRPWQWSKTYGGSRYDNLTAVLSIPGGGYLLAGSSDSPADFCKSEPARGASRDGRVIRTDIWVIRTDARGRQLWDRTLGGEMSETQVT